MVSKFGRNKWFGIKNKIKLSFLAFLIIPILIIVIVSLSSVGILGLNIAEISGEALREEEFRSIEEISLTKSEFIDEVFTGVAKEVNILAQYAHDLFEEEIEVSNKESYYHNDTLNNPPPGLFYDTIEYNRWLSNESSCYVLPYSNLQGKSHYTEQSDRMNFTIEKSSHLDVMFKQMKSITPEYAWIYMGFEIGIHRSYPWHSYSSDYDPRIRPWYQLAKAHNNTLIFTSPYIDSSGRGLMISIAKTVHYHNGTLIGVISADLTIDTIRTSILNTQILESGYAFLIDENGDTVTHPDLESINTPITMLESDHMDFEEILISMKNGENDIKTYIKNDEKWVISYSSIPSTGYSFGVVVPESEIIAPAELIKNDLLVLIGIIFVVMVVVLLGTIIIIGYSINNVSKRIVRPITDLTKMMNFISKGDVSREIPFRREKKLDEVSYLMNSFRNLITLLRLGNNDYYRGDLKKAFNNYSRALEVFRLAENTRGMAICYNNLANIYRIRKESENAENYYKKSIELGKEVEKDEVVALRYNNLAQLYADTQRPKIAEEYFKLALDIYKTSRYNEGIALIHRNLGLLHGRLGSSEKAKELINQAIIIDKELDSDIGMAFNHFYLGLIALKEKDYENAVSQLEISLKYCIKGKDIRLELNILRELEHAYQVQRQNVKARRIKIQYERLKKTLMLRKHVVIVIDVSGSMEGARIQAAVKGALEIYENQLNPNDLISVITFHSESQVLLRAAVKGENEAKVRHLISNIRATPYKTAFYDAVGDSFIILNESVGNEHKWIIALTDGLDNDSTRFSIDDRKYTGFWKILNKDKRIGLAEYIESNLLDMNLMIIGVGDELFKSEQKLKALSERNEQSRYIPAYRTYNIEEEISNAFRKVKDLLAQINVEEFIPE